MINNRFYLKNNYFDSNLGKNELNSKSQANDTQTKCVQMRYLTCDMAMENY